MDNRSGVGEELSCELWLRVESVSLGQISPIGCCPMAMRLSLFDNLSRAGVQHNLDWLKTKHGNRFQFVRGDVRDFDAVLTAIRNVDVVFHLAAQVAVTTSVSNPQRRFFDKCTRDLKRLGSSSKRQEPMPVVLYTSTNKVYGGLEHLRVLERSSRYEFENLPQGVSEACPLDFHSPYGCSKGAADQYVRDYHRIYGLPSIVFRMSCIYGPHQFGNEDQGWVAHFCLTGIRGGHLTIYGDGNKYAICSTWMTLWNLCFAPTKISIGQLVKFSMSEEAPPTPFPFGLSFGMFCDHSSVLCLR